MTAVPPPGASLLRSLENLGRRALHARGFHSHLLSTDHGTIHVLDAVGTGEGPPLVLLHGLGSAGLDLSPLFLQLRAHTRRLLVPDLLGHGWSGPPALGDPDALYGSVAQAVGELLDEPAVLIGNSLGGLVATRWALEHPDRVRGMVLMSPGGAEMDPASLEALLQSFVLRDHDAAVAFLGRVQGVPGAPWLRSLRAWAVRHRMLGSGPQAVLANASAAHLLTPAQIQGIPCPLLVIWGQRDGILPPSHLAFWRANLPDHAVLEEPETFGHSPYLDAPAVIADRIVAFLATLP